MTFIDKRTKITRVLPTKRCSRLLQRARRDCSCRNSEGSENGSETHGGSKEKTNFFGEFYIRSVFVA
jgi:hypothetical protein